MKNSNPMICFFQEDKYQALKEAYCDTAGKLKKLCQKYHEVKMMVSAYQKQERKNVGSTPNFIP